MRKITKRNTFLESIIALIVSQFIVKCIGIVYKIYVTNKEGFGDAGNAIFSSAFQVYAIFLTITSIGVPNAISKLVCDKVAIADNRGAYKILKVSLVVFGLIGFFSSLILFIYSEFIANKFLQIPEAGISLMVLSPSIFFISIESVLKGYFNGKKNINITAKSQTIEQMIKIVFIFLIIEGLSNFYYGNTTIIVAGAALACTISTIFCSLYLYKILQMNKNEIWKESILSKTAEQERILKVIKNILALSLPIAISGLLSSMTKTIDAFTIVRFLKDVIGEKETTLQYGILTGKVETIIALPFSFNIAIATSLIPSIAEDFINKRKYALNRKIEFSFLLTILVGAFSTIIIYIFSNDIIKILFPNASQGAEMLKMSVISILIVVLTQTITGIFQGIGKVNNLVFAFFVGAIVKLIGNIVLIERLGINGAIISTILAQLISLVICIINLNKNIRIKINKKRVILKPIFATGVSYIAMKIIYNNTNMKIIYNCIITALIGILVYIIINIIIKTLEPEEIQEIPKGNKIYEKLVKIGIYKEENTKNLGRKRIQRKNNSKKKDFI